MTEPDELYTLRAQFWLGHFQMALEEAKSIMRRPMSPALKAEREVFSSRCHLALGDWGKVGGNDSPALQALALQAQYEAGNTQVVSQLQSMLGDGVDPSVQLTAAHVLLKDGNKSEALQCVHAGRSLEQVACCLQIYLALDRLDLAQQALAQLRKRDEDSILTQLAGVQVALANGSSSAKEALHTLHQLSEQYGPSPLLLNYMACAYLQAGDYAKAEENLQRAREEFGAQDADTLANLVVACQYQQKPTAELLGLLQATAPNHFLVQGFTMVQGAYEREAMKYRV